MREIARKQVYLELDKFPVELAPFEHTSPGAMNFYTTNLSTGGSVEIDLSYDGGKTWLNEAAAAVNKTHTKLANVVPRARVNVKANNNESMPKVVVEFEEEEKLFRHKIFADATKVFSVEGQVQKVVVVQTAGTGVKMKLEASFDGENFWVAGSNTTAKTGFFENEAVVNKLGNYFKASATAGEDAKFVAIVYYA